MPRLGEDRQLNGARLQIATEKGRAAVDGEERIGRRLAEDLRDSPSGLLHQGLLEGVEQEPRRSIGRIRRRLAHHIAWPPR